MSLRIPRIPPTLSHVLLSVVAWGVVYAAWSAGPHWMSAILASAWWLSRELAQSLRPITMRIEWGWTETRNFAVPAAVVFAVAGLIEWSGW